MVKFSTFFLHDGAVKKYNLKKQKQGRPASAEQPLIPMKTHLIS